MTISNTRRTTRRVYRIGLVISALWLVTAVAWVVVLVRSLIELDAVDTLWERVAVFDAYESYITYGAIISCVLFVTRVAMFLQWPDARLLWRKWYR